MNSICFNDYLQTWIYDKLEWFSFNYSASLSVYKTNLNLCSLPKTLIKPKIQFSSLLNKISQKHTNKKLLLNTIDKLNATWKGLWGKISDMNI